MPQAFQGGYLPYQIASPEIVNDVTAVTLRIFPNEFPLVTRLPREPVGSQTFTMFNYGPRKRQYYLKTALAGSSTDPLDIDVTTSSGGAVDVSMFMKGDIIELTYDAGTKERLEITQVNATSSSVPADADSGSTSSLAANKIRVRRGRDGSSVIATAAAANNSIVLIGNSRTGGEVDQASQRAARTAVDQYCQTWQFPVQVTGTVASTSQIVLPDGVPNLFAGDKLDKLREMYRDMEYSSYYGGGSAPSSSNQRPTQKGLKTLIVTNKITSPTNASAYTQVDFVRDMFQAPRQAGGEVDVVLMSTNWMAGLAKWGVSLQRLDSGTTILGVKVNAYNIPFLSQTAMFVEAPQLSNFTAIGLTSSEVRWRNKRNEFWNQRGNRGDMIEGEWIAEGAIELDNEQHHVWLEGVTAFA
jgi:hypothetical protein